MGGDPAIRRIRGMQNGRIFLKQAYKTIKQNVRIFTALLQE